jgi:EAL domain-containing protein (putative c-di-GMP-specific phosphodiesterase class I)
VTADRLPVAEAPTDVQPTGTWRTHAQHGPAYRIVALAAQVLGVADATLVLVYGDLQGVLATTGAARTQSGPVVRLSEVVASTARPLAVPDLATYDDSAADAESEVRGFLGVPLLDRENEVVGVLYVTDTVPRAFGERDLQLLDNLAAVSADHLELTRQPDGPGRRGVTALARAISRSEIVPWYQPIVDLTTGRLVAVEALARWEHPDGGLEQPAAFIPLAERSNLIVDLDRMVIQQALQDLGRWRVRHPQLRLSVNLSGRHLDLDDWGHVVKELTSLAGVDPTAVSLELTETLRPTEALNLDNIADLRSAGFQVWFDDFGSGWAALQELLTVPLDGLKIDRLFAADLGQHVDDTIVKAIATAGNELGLLVIIEGVETCEQAEIAAALGCHYGQGYLWSRPLPAEHLEALITTADGLLPRLP